MYKYIYIYVNVTVLITRHYCIVKESTRIAGMLELQLSTDGMRGKKTVYLTTFDVSLVPPADIVNNYSLLLTGRNFQMASRALQMNLNNHSRRLPS